MAPWEDFFKPRPYVLSRDVGINVFSPKRSFSVRIEKIGNGPVMNLIRIA